MTALTGGERELLASALCEIENPTVEWSSVGEGIRDIYLRRIDSLAPTVEWIIARHLSTAASAIDTRRHTYVQSGGLPELIPSNHADAERLGHPDGLAAAAEIIRALAAPQTPDADLRP
ncbi:hypothetical protein FB382_003922 [Nocardioides ginsengisegetis]|uniref:Uncharacterized protein n=2 Tax=Nocardioides ginsengisegetis TaxID=661491 RepID=A0A7W3J3E4_9ACTN|nr:hypothetical protein [Nocardioides ginsengisegetis]MBA8805577.1 hypothetical protein [Nocardioides ginsengisegetis]